MPTAKPELAIRLLGPGHVERRGIRLALNREQALGLALLVLRDGCVPRELLGERLWPQSATDAAASSVRGLIVDLRRILGGPARPPGMDAARGEKYIRTVRGKGVEFHAADATVDLQLLETAVARMEHEGASAALEVAALCKAGELLEGHDLIDCPELAARRTAYRTAYRRAVLLLGRDAAGGHRLHDARAYFEQAAELDPLDEESHHELLQVLRSLGELARAVRLCKDLTRRLWDEEDRELSPPLQTLFEEIHTELRANGAGRHHEGERSPGRRSTWKAGAGAIPHPVGRIVGREQEVASVLTGLREHRAVTVAGPPGVGKTRLVVEIAARLESETLTPVAFFDLTPLSSPHPDVQKEVIAGRLASVLAPEPADGDPIPRLVRFFGDRRMVLVLDNCEHLHHGCRRLVRELLHECANLRVIAASRHRLHIDDYLLSLCPLSVPAARTRVLPGNLRDYAATELFVVLATAHRPELVFRPDDAVAVTEICRRLDGLPLSIRLIASRVRVQTLTEIASELRDRLALPDDPLPDLPRRRRSLRAMLEWTYEDLGPGMQQLWRVLSVFAGGCHRKALGALVSALADAGAAPQLAGGPLLDQLGTLDSASVVSMREGLHGESRYYLLETLREYGLSRMPVRERQLLFERHGDYFLRTAEEAERSFHTRGERQSIDRIEAEEDNLRLALDRSEPLRRLRLARAMCWFWYLRGRFAEARQWLERALAPAKEGEAGFDPALCAVVLARESWLACYHEGEIIPGMFRQSQAAVELARGSGDQRALAEALWVLGYQQLPDEEARQPLQEALILARATGDLHREAQCLWGLGFIDHYAERFEEAERAYEESRLVGERISDWESVGDACVSLGELAQERGDLRAARRYLERSLELAVSANDTAALAVARGSLGSLCAEEGRYEEADQLLRDSQELWFEVGDLTTHRTGSPVSYAHLALACGDAESAACLIAAVERAGGGLEGWALQFRRVKERLAGLLDEDTMHRAQERAARLDLKRLSERMVEHRSITLRDHLATLAADDGNNTSSRS